MLTTLTKIFISIIISFLLLSCNANFNNGVTGKGEIVSREITLNEDFNEISIAMGWKVELISSDENKIIMKANENLIPLLKYELDNGSLRIESEKTINKARSKLLKVYHRQPIASFKTSSGSSLSSNEKITIENLDIKTSSGSSIKLDIKTKNADIKTSSGSSVELKGTAINFNSKSSSGSELNAKNLVVKNAKVKTSSGANISIEAKEYLEANTSSGGSINYYGDPEKKKLKQSISGGSINKR